MPRSKFGLAAAIGLCSGAVITAAIAQVALPESVETAPLATDAFSTGTLDRANGALPPTLWRHSDPQTLEFLLSQAPSRPAAPSLGETLRRTLLSPGAGPDGAAPSLGGKKLLVLARAGFFEEARTVASLSNANRGDAWTGQAQAIADLLSGDAAAACHRNAALTSGRDELFWVRLRVFCYARAGERDAADLTLNILREQGGLSGADDGFLSAVAAGVAPAAPQSVETALHFAIAKSLDLPLTPNLLGRADGGVLVAAAGDETLEPGSRIAAAERAVAMGVMAPEALAAVFEGVTFDVAEFSNAAAAARSRPGDPLTDALLYHSVREMTAPEFIRDKAQRIALALSLADSFHRAYALSILYADEITALEGVILTPEESGAFAMARMAVGDSVGAGHWLSAMIGANESVAALPEPQAMAFIERVNLMVVLDPHSASRIARAAGVSLLSDAPAVGPAAKGHDDPVIMARIVEAAFDAAVEGKAGQAGLAALAASNGSGPGGGEVEAVVVSQSLRTAGMAELQRRHNFEHAWAATFSAAAPLTAPEAAESHDDGISPRLKPRSGR